MLTPATSYGFAVAGMTSARGRCHTFDSRADGYVRAEACGSATMGVSELAVHVLGSAVRQDGRSASLTAPNGQAQVGLLRASYADACVAAEAVASVEAHGTGTALGDPIETGSLAQAVLCSGEGSAQALGSVKANAGHSEPAAGIMGLSTLALRLARGSVSPNAQLRVANAHVNDALRGVQCCLPVQLGPGALGAEHAVAGVSSFGYSGTIVHAVLRASTLSSSPCPVGAALVYRRRAFPWRSSMHPLSQSAAFGAGPGSTCYRSVTSGALIALVRDHVVGGRVVFPGAAYLEMVHAARSAMSASSPASSSLADVLFAQPLVLGEGSSPALVECEVGAGGAFEVRSFVSLEPSPSADTVHCTGSVAVLETAWQPADVATRRVWCAEAAVDVESLYALLHRGGLQYGPDFRPLQRAWASREPHHALALLRTRARH